jgi:hypothetical protein
MAAFLRNKTSKEQNCPGMFFTIRQRVEVSDAIHTDMVDLQHGWWFPELDSKLPDLFGVFESNANILCPDEPEFCSPEIGSWPHSALLCNIKKENPDLS